MRRTALLGIVGAALGAAAAPAQAVNDVGAITDVETDVAGVFQDEAEIANVIYEETR